MAKELTSGALCLDMGIAVSLKSKRWCNLHRLMGKLKFRITITSVLGKALDIMALPP